MFRFVIPRQRTRVWLGVEALADGELSIDRAAADLAAAITAIEGRGGEVQHVAIAPLPTPGGTSVLLAVTYREPTGLPDRR